MRTLANVKSVEELRPMEISLADGRRIRLDQVATITDGIAEPRSLAFYNGKRVVGFEVSRSRGASEVEVGAGVQKTLADLRLLNPDIEQSMVIDILGQLHAHQDGDRADNSAGVISRLDSAVIVGITDLDLFDGYIVARSETHNGAEIVRTRLTAEKLTSRIPGFYWQHLSYVVIWWLMAAVVLYLPFYRRKVDL